MVFEDAAADLRASSNARANQLAHHLRALGVGPDVLVGHLHGALARDGRRRCSASSRPAAPTCRWIRPIQPSAWPSCSRTAQAPVLLTAERCSTALLPEHQRPHVLCLDADWPSVDRQPADAIRTAAPLADNLAYVIYTSGSTGSPRACMITHRGSSTVSAGCTAAYAARARRRRSAAVRRSRFDSAIYELFAPLLHRRRLVVLVPTSSRDSMRSGRRCSSSDVTTPDPDHARASRVAEQAAAAEAAATRTARVHHRWRER